MKDVNTLSYPVLSRDSVPENVEVAMIWAQTTGRVIGDGNDMPWYLPEDLRHFSTTTMGASVIMGRTSWEALEDPYRPLPGRTNFVVSRNSSYSAPGALLCQSIPDALAQAAQYEREHHPEVERPTLWILGGGQVYEQCMPIADRLVITDIDMVAPERFSVYAPLIELAGDSSDSQSSRPLWHAEHGPWLISEKGHSVTGNKPLRYRISTYIQNFQ